MSSRSNSFHSTPPDSPKTIKKTSNLTQTDILRSRIEEQSNLITILKNRNDQLLAKINASDLQNETLINQQTTLKTQLLNENKRFSKLENHFNTLAKNHQEMIDIKDEYKNANEKLIASNKTITLENLKLKNELQKKDNKKVMELTLEINNLQTSLKIESDLLEQQRNLNMQKSSDLMRKDEQVRDLKDRIKIIEKNNQVFQDNIKQTEVDCKNQIARKNKIIKELENEQKRLVDSNFKRGELLNKLEQENKDFKIKIEELLENVRLLERKWKDECDKIDVNYKVRSLMSQLEECKLEITEIEMHKSRLRSELNNQKQLNDRLRNYK